MKIDLILLTLALIATVISAIAAIIAIIQGGLRGKLFQGVLTNGKLFLNQLYQKDEKDIQIVRTQSEEYGKEDIKKAMRRCLNNIPLPLNKIEKQDMPDSETR